MTITIRLKTDNAAFQPEPEAEIMRILNDLMLSFARMGLGNRALRDYNGNIVGSVTVRGK